MIYTKIFTNLIKTNFMERKLFRTTKLGYIEPSIYEMEVKVEAGFATSNNSLEGIPEDDADNGF